MAMEPERSKTLHNFSLPCLKWGTQKYLRCMKIPTDTKTETSHLDRRSHPSNGNRFDANRESSSSPARPIATTSKFQSNNDRDNGINAVREKLVVDLKVAVNRIESSILEGRIVTEADSAAGRRSLRTRRAALKALPPSEDKRINNLSPARVEIAADCLRGAGMEQRAERKKKVKFSVPLSKDEIEDDFIAMVGRRPPRRPKKRAKVVQRQLDSLFPGLWLTEVTPDAYKVPDVPEP